MAGIDPSIILGVKPIPYQAPDPMEQYGKSLALKGLMGQQELQGIQLERAKMEAAKLKAFQDRIANIPGTPDSIPEYAQAMIATGNPDYIKSGIALQQRYEAHKALMGLGGGGGQPASPMDPNGPNPSVMAGAPGTIPPTSTVGAQGPALNSRVLALLAAQTPETTKAAEFLNNAEIEARKPVINRGFGVGTMVNGKYVPDPASQTQALDLKRGEADINASRDLVKVQNSDQTYSYIPRSQLVNAAQPTMQPAPAAPAAPAATPQVTPPGGWKVPPALQAQRDQQARVIQARETQPNGGGAIPTQALIGPPRFGQTQEQQIEQAAQTAAATSKARGQGEQQADRPTATLAMNDAASNLDRLAQQAESLQKHPGIGRITGLAGALPNVPGMAGADAQAKLDTLKSQAAFTVLQAMRNASKSGGALGQVSDREELMLANNLAALQNSQSEGALKDNLQRIIDWSKGAKARMQNAYDMTYKGAEAAAPAGNAALAGTAPTQADIDAELRRRGVIK